jgi:catechol 2,3-dioxygenase-like lactoylglutathione lyase family enzyme
MHHSRLAGFIVDCRTQDLEGAASFWSAALGMPTDEREDVYVGLDASPRDLVVAIQRVDHDSRVHLDIESDDVEAEVRRLEALGARRIGAVKTWVVLEAPTGQRFCVVRAKQPLAGVPGATRWPSS